MTVPLESSVRVIADSVGSGLRMRVLPDAIKVVVRLLQYYELKRFVVKTRKLFE